MVQVAKKALGFKPRKDRSRHMSSSGRVGSRNVNQRTILIAKFTSLSTRHAAALNYGFSCLTCYLETRTKGYGTILRLQSITH